MATATALETGHVTEVGTEGEWNNILSQAQEEDKTVTAAHRFPSAPVHAACSARRSQRCELVKSAHGEAGSA